jgi:hypothetical protein
VQDLDPLIFDHLFAGLAGNPRQIAVLTTPAAQYRLVASPSKKRDFARVDGSAAE